MRSLSDVQIEMVRSAAAASKLQTNGEVSDVVARILPVRNKPMLVHVTHVCAKFLPDRNGDSYEAAKAFQSVHGLKTRGVQIEEGFLAERQCDFAAAAERHRVTKVGPQSPPGAVLPITPAL